MAQKTGDDSGGDDYLGDDGDGGDDGSPDVENSGGDESGSRSDNVGGGSRNAGRDDQHVWAYSYIDPVSGDENLRKRSGVSSAKVVFDHVSNDALCLTTIFVTKGFK